MCDLCASLSPAWLRAFAPLLRQINPSVEEASAASADRPSSLSRQLDGLIKTAPPSQSLSPAGCTSRYCLGTIILATPLGVVRKLFRTSRRGGSKRPLLIRAGLMEGESWRPHGRGRCEVEGRAVRKDERHGGTNQNADAVVIPTALRLRSRHLPSS